MPRPPAILVSLITVTFIAVGQIPKKWLHSVFCVRHQAVHDALCWLKANNPKYYRDVEVSASELAQLPVDDVPNQIMAIIRQTEDVGVINEENDSYVPQDPDEGQYQLTIARANADGVPLTVLAAAPADDLPSDNVHVSTEAGG